MPSVSYTVKISWVENLIDPVYPAHNDLVSFEKQPFSNLSDEGLKSYLYGFSKSRPTI